MFEYQVCRTSNQTIQGCSALVYIIECHIFQVAAGPSVATITSSGKRLTLLNQWLDQKRVENLEELRRSNFPRPENDGLALTGQMFVVPWEEWAKETRTMDGRYMRLGLEHQPAFASQFVYVEEPTEYQDIEFQVTNDWPVVIYDFDTPGSLARDTASKDIASRQSIVSEPPNLKNTAQELPHNPMIASAPYRRIATGLSADMRSEQCWDGNCLVSSVTFDENRWVTGTMYSI